MGSIKSLVNYFLKHEFIRFILVGGSVTFLDWILFYVLSIKLGIYYQLAIVMGFVIAMTVNFILSKTFTYRSKSKKIIKEYFIYAGISVISLICTMGLMFVFVELAFLDKMLSKVITTGIMLFINYLIHKNITFNKKLFREDDLVVG